MFWEVQACLIPIAILLNHKSKYILILGSHYYCTVYCLLTGRKMKFYWKTHRDTHTKKKKQKKEKVKRNKDQVIQVVV